MHTRHGIGMYTMTECMLMSFLPSATRSGGIGVGHGVFPARIGGSVGGGLRRGITAAGIILIGMEITGEAIGAVIGGRTGITIIIMPEDIGADGVLTDTVISVRAATPDILHLAVMLWLRAHAEARYAMAAQCGGGTARQV